MAIVLFIYIDCFEQIAVACSLFFICHCLFINNGICCLIDILCVFGKLIKSFLSSICVKIFRLGIKSRLYVFSIYALFSRILDISVYDIGCTAVLVRNFFICRRAYAEQMPAVTEQSVICPIRCRRADAYHRYVINQEHNNRENRKSKPTVCNNTVDFIGCGKLTRILFLIAAFYKLSYINISFICNDAFRIIVKLFFRRLNISFNML